MHHKSCQEELEEKIQELRSLQVSSSLEKEHLERLSDTIRELEEVLFTQQEELAAKDKEIELIEQNSVENQLPVDSLLGNEVILFFSSISNLFLKLFSLLLRWITKAILLRTKA